MPLITNSDSSEVIHQERPSTQVFASAQNTNHSGNLPEAPPIANTYTFVADTGGNLDQYLGRSDLASGLLKFQIGVNAPVLTPEQVSVDGFLLGQHFLALVDQNELPT